MRGLTSLVRSQNKNVQQEQEIQDVQGKDERAFVDDDVFDRAPRYSSAIFHERVRVTVRVRPPIMNEVGGAVKLDKQNNKYITVNRYEPGSSDLQFDRVFGPESTQADVYEHAVKPIVEDVTRGYNGTIIAYGQTGAGKTYTLTSIEPDTIGMMPRAANEVFNDVKADVLHETRVYMSYIQIYMEIVKDLLDPVSAPLSIREAANGVYLAGVKEKEVNNTQDCLKLLALGEQNRVYAFTNMNAQSSRSHCIVMMKVVKKKLDQEQKVTATKSGGSMIAQQVKVGRLFIVDLAGSERLKKSNSTGIRASEAKSINYSLTMLGMCINARSDPTSTHVPFRDSKLTRLLQESLGGNTKTCMIVNVSDVSTHVDETAYSLNFGSRAMNVKNKPIVNEHVDYKVLNDELMNKLSVSQVQKVQLEGKLAEKQEQLETMSLSLKKEQAKFQTILDNLNKEKRERDNEVRKAEEEKKRSVQLQDVKLSKAHLQLQAQKQQREQMERRLLELSEESKRSKIGHENQLQKLKAKLADLGVIQQELQKQLADTRACSQGQVEKVRVKMVEELKLLLSKNQHEVQQYKDEKVQEIARLKEHYKVELDKLRKTMAGQAQTARDKLMANHAAALKDQQELLDDTVYRMQDTVHEAYTWQEKHKAQAREMQNIKQQLQQRVNDLELQLQESDQQVAKFQNEIKQLKAEQAQQRSLLGTFHARHMDFFTARRVQRERLYAAVAIQKNFRRYKQRQLEQKLYNISQQLNDRQHTVQALQSHTSNQAVRHQKDLAWLGASLVATSADHIKHGIESLFQAMVVPSKQLSAISQAQSTVERLNTTSSNTSFSVHKKELTSNQSQHAQQQYAYSQSRQSSRSRRTLSGFGGSNGSNGTMRSSTVNMSKLASNRISS